jgi:hypothetical protein
MYLGSTTEYVPVWAQRLVSWGTETYRCGTTEQPVHQYRCERCGKEFRFPVQAQEPFYCYCNQHLVQVS